MNELFPEQFAAAQKAHLETFYGLANLAFEGFQKLTELNLQATRSALSDTHKLLSVADPQVFFAQQTSPNGAVTERIRDIDVEQVRLIRKRRRLRTWDRPQKETGRQRRWRR